MYSENTELVVDDYVDQEDDLLADGYDITAIPNDFNVMTLYSFIESGAVSIPGFQRNFVWDIGRSSKLIESLLLGLPVPQLFLYEKTRNKFLVIDGQQRLMSIYYFIRKRFPRKEKRAELRNIFDNNHKIPDDILHNNNYFEDFNLKLSNLSNEENKFHGLNYSTLRDDRTQLDLRPIRNIIVKQNAPTNDDSSMFEIFNRLNTGGVNLRPQEIRVSMYHSKFYDMLFRINRLPEWRKILGASNLDVHMKDIEILLRSFAMLMKKDEYKPSMAKFLNQFSKTCEGYSAEEIEYLEGLFKSFLAACSQVPSESFRSRSRGSLFNIAIFEAVFFAACKKVYDNKDCITKLIEKDSIHELANDVEFSEALLKGTTHARNVNKRLDRAIEIIRFKD
ncbi:MULTISPECIES: DUF262 domain-containing protein [unclassified Neisseria]|uniref:GmrSD restriction endonuclease domain-containing protein n=1 Tax=unclassified Neisseria TaxID=2623750 RepID=UPI0010719AEE|nr:MULTISPECIES: DUF262 domain-containing protein [unclassified Neisseria]MBF0803547.1 DUF262 domain-containing protein [Neisseria sp. 19428wB4_WF04]TFU43728.1 DUF262 domain-containing protein [Neisseria sp. WF04]